MIEMLTNKKYVHPRVRQGLVLQWEMMAILYLVLC